MQNISAKDIRLAIALLKECNLSCAYCDPVGENKMSWGRDMSLNEAKAIIDSAHDTGFKLFRLTGGEPMSVQWFSEILAYLLSKDNDSKINISTNATFLNHYLDLIEQNKERIKLGISLDSLIQSKKKQGIEKILTNGLDKNLKEASKRGINVRLNTVVTKLNVDEVPDLISYASTLGFDIKLLELFYQDRYIATEKNKENPKDWWKNNYVDLTSLIPELQSKSNKEMYPYTKDSLFGVPIRAFNLERNLVLLQDSTNGAYFSKSKCVDSCPHFGDDCQNGVYSPLITSNMVALIDGCRNEKLRWNLRGKSLQEQKSMLQEIVGYFQDLAHINAPLKAIKEHKNI